MLFQRFSTLRFGLFLVVLFLLPVPGLPGQGELSASDRSILEDLVGHNETFAGGHTGLALYDLATGAALLTSNADRLFVPASNLKLFTFFLAHRLLGRQAPGLLYQEFADRYEVWGGGYGLLLHPEFLGSDEVYPWLAGRGKPIRINFPSGPGQDVARYGSGWSYDDYNDGYVYERSVFPVYGNRLFIDLAGPDSLGRRFLSGTPPSVVNGLRTDHTQGRILRRSEFGNDFTVAPDWATRARFPLERALHLRPRLIVNELAAALPGRFVRYGARPYPPAGEARRLTVSLPDTVYRRVLRRSDNFLAEQLLVQAAIQRYGRPAVPALLDYAKDSLLAPLGIEGVRWADGSGLSRYSLFTPRHLVYVLLALDREVGWERLLTLLPAGGGPGTLERRFANRPETYVWAKTGSLSGVICLSGFLRTRAGRWLAFSFMHNNFVGGSSAYYREMEKVLGWCYDRL